MIDLINLSAHSWWDWMWPMFWQVALLIVVVGVVDRATQRWVWPQVRYALWLLVLVKLVLPPSLSSPASLAALVLPEPAVSVAHPAPLPPAPVPSFGPVRLPPIEQPIPRFLPTPQTAPAPAPPLAPPEPIADPLSWRAGLMFMWAMGVLVFAAWAMARFRSLRRDCEVWSKATPCPEEWRHLVEDVSVELRLRRTPDVIFSAGVRSPAVFGLWRPVVLMPLDLARQEPDASMRYILLHELAHIRRGDLRVHAAFMALQIVYWFHPLLWLARRRVCEVRELCCDASVASILREETPHYRETLLRAAERFVKPRALDTLGILGLVERPGNLLTRLRRLEKALWRHKKLRITAVVLTAGVMALCVLPMVGSQPDDAPVVDEKTDGDTTIADKPAKNKDGFNIYLLADASTHLEQARKTPLKELVLQDEPWIASDDIERYDVSSHCIYLKKDIPKAWERIQIRGTPFVVTVDGEPEYLGALWTPISSAMPSEPTPLISDPLWAMSSPDLLHISAGPRAYKHNANGALEEDDGVIDPRASERIVKALRRDKQYRPGPEVSLDAVRIEPREGGASVEYTYTVTNRKESPLYVLDPKRVDADYFHSWQNGVGVLVHEDQDYSGDLVLRVDESQLKHPKPDEFDPKWFTRLELGEPMTRTVRIDAFPSIPAGRYKCLFQFGSPNFSHGFTGSIPKDQRTRDDGRLWLGQLADECSVIVSEESAGRWPQVAATPPTPVLESPGAKVEGQRIIVRVRFSASDWKRVYREDNWACHVRIDGKDFQYWQGYPPFDEKGKDAFLDLTQGAQRGKREPFHYSAGEHRVQLVFKDVDVIDPKAPDEPKRYDELASNEVAFTVVASGSEEAKALRAGPKYEGKTIDEWLDELAGVNTNNSLRLASDSVSGIGEPMIEPLMELMEAGDPRSYWAAESLVGMGQVARSTLPRLLEWADGQGSAESTAFEDGRTLRWFAIHALRQMSWASDQSVPVFQRAAGDERVHSGLRRSALLAVGDQGALGATALRELIKIEDDRLRRYAVDALGKAMVSSGQIDRRSYYRQTIENDPFDANVPWHLVRTKTSGKVSNEKPHLLTQEMKTLYRRHLKDNPSPEVAWNLARVIQTGLANTGRSWSVGSMSGYGEPWLREDPEESFVTMGAALKVGFNAAEKNSDLWRKLGESLARQRLLAGDWAGMNTALQALGQEPIPAEERPWLTAPPADWSNLREAWRMADGGWITGDCSLELRFEKDGKGLAGVHVLVKEQEPPSRFMRTGRRVDNLSHAPYPINTDNHYEGFGYRGDLSETRYAVSDDSGIVRFEQLPKIDVLMEVVVATGNFVEAGTIWDLYMEVTPGNLLLMEHGSGSDLVTPFDEVALVKLKRGKTVRYPKVIVNPR